MNGIYDFTSESVAAGHPDKLCDQISDAILDEFLKVNHNARTAIEVLAHAKGIVVAGEASNIHDIGIERINEIARLAIKDVGYSRDDYDYENIEVQNFLVNQSSEIASSVIDTSGDVIGAGDQGIMFGYACDETESLMPAAIFYSHKILYNLMQQNDVCKIGPDAKSQVTVRYDQMGVPLKASAVLISMQHQEHHSKEDLYDIAYPVILDTLPKGWVDGDTKIFINPSSSFIKGGPAADAGLTGRKIIVDTYGGAAPHGGGAFSGKDPTKVDRSAAYMTRYLAKNIVAKKWAKRCLVQIAFGIGMAQPISIFLNTFGTNTIAHEDIMQWIKSFDLSPSGIISYLRLKKPIYKATAAYGHFGRDALEDGSFSWEAVE